MTSTTARPYPGRQPNRSHRVRFYGMLESLTEFRRRWLAAGLPGAGPIEFHDDLGRGVHRYTFQTSLPTSPDKDEASVSLQREFNEAVVGRRVL